MLRAESFTSTRQPIQPQSGPFNSCVKPFPQTTRTQFILHDRDAIFSTGFDASVARMGVEVIQTPISSPQANSLCERLIGTLRRECLDWIIPLTEEHLRRALRSWLRHYNRGRPTLLWGPAFRSVPESPRAGPTPEAPIRPSKPSRGALRTERTSPRVTASWPALRECRTLFADDSGCSDQLRRV
jgi:Integrase core domain